jgi:hypothetical protein
LVLSPRVKQFLLFNHFKLDPNLVFSHLGPLLLAVLFSAGFNGLRDYFWIKESASEPIYWVKRPNNIFSSRSSLTPSFQVDLISLEPISFLNTRYFFSPSPSSRVFRKNFLLAASFHFGRRWKWSTQHFSCMWPSLFQWEHISISHFPFPLLTLKYWTTKTWISSFGFESEAPNAMHLFASSLTRVVTPSKVNFSIESKILAQIAS